MNRWILSSIVCLALAACVSSPVIDAPSRNQNSRVNFLVIHFTTENFRDSLALLTERSDDPVSAHYLIPEPYDDTYTRRSLKVHKLVDESRRAWHAGNSFWNGEEALNDRSIGIELVNRSYCVENPNKADESVEENEVCFYPDFADAQIALLIDLARGILDRHPEIDPVDVVGHADIAPDRKVDPGPRFPWQALYKAGIGAWYDDGTVLSYRTRFEDTPIPTAVVQRALRAYGYRIDVTGENDAQSRDVLRAFQMHFRPMGVTGEVDIDTVAALFALIDKYRSETLEDLLDYSTDPTLDTGLPTGVDPGG